MGHSDVKVGRVRGHDWIQLMAQGPLRTEDVTHSLLASMRQSTEKNGKKGVACHVETKRLGSACT